MCLQALYPRVRLGCKHIDAMPVPSAGTLHVEAAAADRGGSRAAAGARALCTRGQALYRGVPVCLSSMIVLYLW